MKPRLPSSPSWDESRFAGLSVPAARAWLLLFLSVAAIGMVIWKDAGKLPIRPAPAEAGSAETKQKTPAVDTGAPAQGAKLAPDLSLYQEMVIHVREGRGYYPQLRARLLHYGFPVGSTFNWRLPTYAYLFAFLGGEWQIQATLILIYGGSLLLLLAPLPCSSSPVDERAAGASTLPSWLGVVLVALLQMGIFTWCIDGFAFYAQEVWGAALITGAIACMRRGWDVAAVAFSLSAVCMRELALPLLVAPLLICIYRRRPGMAATWAVAIMLFMAFLYWHSQQVAAQFLPEDRQGSGLGQWLTLGGVDFVLLTTRMNRLLLDAPGSLLWLAWMLGLLGLLRSRTPFAETLLLMCLGYFGAFLFVGMPVNMYWGLLFAPPLAWGIATAPAALFDLAKSARLLPSS